MTVMPFPRSTTMKLPYGGKPGLSGNDHVVLSAGTVDDLDIAALIPAANDSHVAVLGVEHQVSRLGLVPRNRRAVPMLGLHTLPIPYGILPV